MRSFTFALLIIAITSIGPAFGGETPLDKEIRQLQGLWQIREIRVHVVDDNNPGEEFSKIKWRWSINGNKLTWTMPGIQDKEETITLGVRGNLKLIDLTNGAPKGVKGQRPIESEKHKWTLYGIYELEKNVLRVCLPINQAGANLRPVEMTGVEGTGCMVWILERVETKK